MHARHILVATEDEGKALIAEIESDLSDKLAKRGMTARVLGREKRPYSIWLKMQRKNIGFEQLADIMAFRVVVDDIAGC